MKPAALLFLPLLFLLSACGDREGGSLLVESSLRGQEVTSISLDCQTEECIEALRSVDLDPLPEGTFCTKIYGGPQEISLAGKVDGKDITASFNRSGGCEITRFDSAVNFLEKNGIKYQELFPESSIRESLGDLPRAVK